MQDELLVEEVDVRRLDDPEDSRVCLLSKVQFPAIKLKTAETTPGGGALGVKRVLPIAEPLEPSYSTKGLDRGAAAAVGLIPGIYGGWTFAASVRNVENNTVLPVRATIKGTIAEYNIGEHTPGDLLDTDMVIHEVTDYELKIGNDIWFKISRKPRVLIMFGNDIFARYVSALGA